MNVTICTPTYNRANCLEKLYNSLVNQTNKDFEWLIIDDGSNDNTYSLVSEWVDAKLIDIKYFYKENGGKHSALNLGVANSSGKYFAIVDSDDFLIEDAVQIIVSKFADLPLHYAGIGLLKVFLDGSLVGSTFDGDFIDCTSLKRSKYKILGDKFEVFYTSILKNFSFPVFDNEKFLTEALVWNRIANAGYKIRWYNEKVYICEYRSDGLSINTNYSKNFKGYSLFISELISYKDALLIDKIKYLGVYFYNANNINIKDKEACKLVTCSIVFAKFCKYIYKIKKNITNKKRHEDLKIK